MKSGKTGWLSGIVLVAITSAAGAALAADRGHYGFTVFGSYEAMHRDRDFESKISLEQISGQRGTWGLGALAGMAGEALLADGRILVSPGTSPQGQTRVANLGEGSAMFGMAQVRRWKSVRTERVLDGAGLRARILAEREKQGFGNDTPFPFLVRGRFVNLGWHVINGPPPAPMRQFTESDASGQLIGLYSGAEFEGKITARGNRFHIHFLNRKKTRSGHVDAITVPAGSQILIPRD